MAGATLAGSCAAAFAASVSSASSTTHALTPVEHFIRGILLSAHADFDSWKLATWLVKAGEEPCLVCGAHYHRGACGTTPFTSVAASHADAARLMRRGAHATISRKEQTDRA